MAQHLEREGTVESAQDLVDLLLDRERLGATVVGDETAIPHCKVPGLKHIVAAFARTPESVSFGSGEGDRARLFFFVLSPREQPAAHLQVLANIARLLRNPQARRHCLEARSRRRAAGRSDPVRGGIVISKAARSPRSACSGTPASTALRLAAGGRRGGLSQRPHQSAAAEAGSRAGRLPRVRQAGPRPGHRLERERVPRHAAGRGRGRSASTRSSRSAPAPGRHARACATPPRCSPRRASSTASPLAISEATTSVVIEGLSSTLEFLLAPREIRHGDLLDIFAIGVLLLGESGSGKSECALELVHRGHRLVADDIVEIYRVRDEDLVGQAPEEVRGLMEVRGLGLISIEQLFGVVSVRDNKPIDLLIKLVSENTVHLDRLGLAESSEEILGLVRPCLTVPVAPGRSLSLLVECAARKYLLSQRGVPDAAREYLLRHDRRLERP